MILKYLALLRRAVGLTLEYRAGILIWMIANVMPLVMLAVWYSLSEGGPISGYTQDDFVSYYLLLTFTRQMTTVWVIWELSYEIRHGALSIRLLHPLAPIHAHIASHLADKVFRLIILMPLAFFAWLIFPTIHYDLTPLNIVLFLLALVIGFLIRFVSQFCFGILAFWISEATTINEIWYALSLMIGGVVAPLDLFPEQVKAVANYLPFRYMLSFPVEIVSGRLTPNDLQIGLFTMTGWLVFFLVLYQWMWRQGIKQFSAFGA